MRKAIKIPAEEGGKKRSKKRLKVSLLRITTLEWDSNDGKCFIFSLFDFSFGENTFDDFGWNVQAKRRQKMKVPDPGFEHDCLFLSHWLHTFLVCNATVNRSDVSLEKSEDWRDRHREKYRLLTIERNYRWEKRDLPFGNCWTDNLHDLSFLHAILQYIQINWFRVTIDSWLLLTLLFSPFIDYMRASEWEDQFGHLLTSLVSYLLEIDMHHVPLRLCVSVCLWWCQEERRLKEGRKGMSCISWVSQFESNLFSFSNPDWF